MQMRCFDLYFGLCFDWNANELLESSSKYFTFMHIQMVLLIHWLFHLTGPIIIKIPVKTSNLHKQINNLLCKNFSKIPSTRNSNEWNINREFVNTQSPYKTRKCTSSDEIKLLSIRFPEGTSSMGTTDTGIQPPFDTKTWNF